MPVPIDLTQPVNLAVIIKDQSVTVGNTNLTHAEVAALAQHLEAERALLVVRGAGDRAYAGFCAAQRKGDAVGGARGLVATIEQSLPALGVQAVSDVDLSQMPQRDGAVAAARATAAVIEAQEPASSARDQKIAVLRQHAAAAEVFDILRDSLQALERQVGGNEVQVLHGVQARVDFAVEPYRHRLAAEPLLKRDLEPALEYLDGAAAQAAATRKRNDAWRAAAETRLKAELTAAARAEGRRDATDALSDRINALFTKGA